MDTCSCTESSGDARVDLFAVDGPLGRNGRRVRRVQNRVVAQMLPRRRRQVPQVSLAAAAEAVLVLYLRWSKTDSSGTLSMCHTFTSSKLEMKLVL